MRVGIAGVVGAHVYSGVGQGLLSRDPGAAGTTAFVGLRGFLGAELGGAARLHLGLQLSLDDDLARIREPYTYRESGGLFSDRTFDTTTTHTVGFLRFGTAIALGGAFDL